MTATAHGARPMPGCRPEEVAHLVMRFFAAFNRGDQAELSLFFPESRAGILDGSTRTFQWYSVTEGPTAGGRHFVTYNLEQLFPYFAQRHEQHEHLQLRSIRVSEDKDRGLAHIAYILTRQADDLAPRLGGAKRTAEGKGAIHCTTQRIIVWSMAMTFVAADEEQAYLNSVWPCPKLAAGQVPTATIVCSR